MEEDRTITVIGGEMLIGEREDYKKKKDEFLGKLNALNPHNLLFYRENYPLAVVLGPGGLQRGDRFSASLFCLDAELPLKGIDLDNVKHINYSELAPMTHRIDDYYVLGKTLFGRLLQAEGIFVKTWDLFFPSREIIGLHSKRLRNEIMILTSMYHPCLPKLVGYSIDKQFAVVYQQKPSWTLHHFLSRPDLKLTWDERIEVAAQIASLMEYFHSMGKTLGSIDPQNILVDMDMNVKLCEFDLCGTIDALRTLKLHPRVYPDAWCLPGGVYSFQVPERMSFQDPMERVEWTWTWTEKSDIYCFGCLLLELISTEIEHSVQSRRRNDWREWAMNQLVKKSEKNLVDKCLTEDRDVGAKVTRIVMSCLNKCPDDRAEAKAVVRELNKLKAGKFSGSQKRSPLEQEEDSLHPEKKRQRSEEYIGAY